LLTATAAAILTPSSLTAICWWMPTITVASFRSASMTAVILIPLVWTVPASAWSTRCMRTVRTSATTMPSSSAISSRRIRLSLMTNFLTAIMNWIFRRSTRSWTTSPPSALRRVLRPWRWMPSTRWL